MLLVIGEKQREHILLYTDYTYDFFCESATYAPVMFQASYIKRTKN